MARLYLVAVVMCEFPPRLRSARMRRGLAPEVQSSGHPEHGHTAYSEELLACKHLEEADSAESWEERIIIQGKDEAFVEYDHAVGELLYSESTSPISCKSFQLPPKPFSMLRHLPSHTLPEDVIGVIAASFSHDVHCLSCRLLSFNMTFFERCRTAVTQHQWERVHKEVEEEGGSCQPSATFKESTLHSCLSSPQTNQVAVCLVQFKENDVEVIDVKEKKIKANEDEVESHRQAIKKKVQEHQGCIEKEKANIQDLHDTLRMQMQHVEVLESNIKESRDAIEEHQQAIEEINEESQEFIKQRQDNVKDLQDALDTRKQNIVYLKQIFEDL